MQRKRIRYRTKRMLVMIGVVIAIVFLGVVTSNILQTRAHRRTFEYKLTNIGWSEEDANFLIEKLSKEELEKLLEQEVNTSIVSLMRERYFISALLNRYLEFKSENENMSYSDIIALINTGAYRDWYSDIKETNLEDDVLILVNKFYSLPEGHKPDNLVRISNRYSFGNNPEVRADVLAAFLDMFYEFSSDNYNVRFYMAASPFRTYESQASLYNIRVTQVGRDRADQEVARPGHSEHQTGLAIDIAAYGSDWQTFASSPAGLWLAANAHNYGFILRYPEGKEHITGFTFEPWHYRFVGVETATYIFNNNITFDEWHAFYRR